MFCVFFICLPFFAPPAPAVPDGRGGYVPFTNSRVMPDGSLRPYDPRLDGILTPDGRVVMLAPPPPGLYRPDYNDPPPQPFQQRRYHAPHLSQPCYDQNGQPVEPAPPDCRTGRSAAEPQKPSKTPQPQQDSETKQIQQEIMQFCQQHPDEDFCARLAEWLRAHQGPGDHEIN